MMEGQFKCLRRPSTKTHSDWVAVRVAKGLLATGDVDNARQVLERCARENPGSKVVNFVLAQLHLNHGWTEEKGRILGHLRRSFTEGDTHYDAQ